MSNFFEKSYKSITVVSIRIVELYLFTRPHRQLQSAAYYKINWYY